MVRQTARGTRISTKRTRSEPKTTAAKASPTPNATPSRASPLTPLEPQEIDGGFNEHTFTESGKKSKVSSWRIQMSAHEMNQYTCYIESERLST